MKESYNERLILLIRKYCDSKLILRVQDYIFSKIRNKGNISLSFSLFQLAVGKGSARCFEEDARCVSAGFLFSINS